MAPVIPREGGLQSERWGTANRINKNWPINRASRVPRGLFNRRNACYRLSALQSLLHLPRFCNWILQHNKKDGEWPCDPNDVNLTIPPDVQEVFDFTVVEESGEENYNSLTNYRPTTPYTGCMPCLLKALIINYWGNVHMAPGTDTTPTYPRPFAFSHPAILYLHQLVERWFCREPLGYTDPPNLSLAKKKQMKLKAKQGEMCAQQDSEEFLIKLFEAILNDSNPNHLPIPQRDNYEALFSVALREIRNCDLCHEDHFNAVEEQSSLRIRPDTVAGDTVERGIARIFDGVEPHENTLCDRCSQISNKTRTFSIDAAPEYLRISLNLIVQAAPKAVRTKNRQHIAIPDVLDITRHMTFRGPRPYPVRYKLITAIHHIGTEITGGHYTAGVTGPKERRAAGNGPRYLCNDSNVSLWQEENSRRPNVLRRNPANLGLTMDMDVTELFYERLARTWKPPVPAKSLPKLPPQPQRVGETIADRLRTKQIRRSCRNK